MLIELFTFYSLLDCSANRQGPGILFFGRQFSSRDLQIVVVFVQFILVEVGVELFSVDFLIFTEFFGIRFLCVFV